MFTKTIFTICVFTIIFTFFLAFALDTSLSHFLEQADHKKCLTASVKNLNKEKSCSEYFNIYNIKGNNPSKNKTACTAFWNWANCTKKVLFNTSECKKFEPQLKKVFLNFTEECKTQVCDLSKLKPNSSLSNVLNWGVVVIIIVFFSSKHIFTML